MLMEDPRDAEDAVRELDGSRMCGRKVKVNLSALRNGSASDNRKYWFIKSLFIRFIEMGG